MRLKRKGEPSYTIFSCPHCHKYIGADIFRLQDLNAKKRARFTVAEKAGVEKE